GPGKEPIHVLVLLYAGSQDARNALCERVFGEGGGIRVLRTFDTWAFCNPALRYKEHFGFTDGLAQPSIAHLNDPEPAQGAMRRRPPDNAVAAGEFLLGYGNELRTTSPGGPTVTWNGRRFELGRNGSYVVLRQLKQDVYRFWNFLSEQAGQDDENALL